MWLVSASQQNRVDRRSLTRFFGSSSGSGIIFAEVTASSDYRDCRANWQSIVASVRSREATRFWSGERSAVAAPLREAEQGRP